MAKNSKNFKKAEKNTTCNGCFSSIPDFCLDVISKGLLSKRQIQIYMAILMRSYGFSHKHHKTAKFSFDELAKLTGIKRHYVTQIVAELKNERLINVKPGSGRGSKNIYEAIVFAYNSLSPIKNEYQKDTYFSEEIEEMSIKKIPICTTKGVSKRDLLAHKKDTYLMPERSTGRGETMPERSNKINILKEASGYEVVKGKTAKEIRFSIN